MSWCIVPLSHSVSATGVGLHHGNKVFLTINPAPEDTGIVFRLYDDLNHEAIVEIPARSEYVGYPTMHNARQRRSSYHDG